jgi:class 3 adenylate cyclase
MFVDLVGSTTLSAQLDPEDLRELLATYHGMVGEVVKAHGGHVAQFLGDGALVYFGYPISHEDDGERAIKTGLSLLERTRRLTMHRAEINIRIGLATGLVVVGDKAVGSDAAHEPRIMGETPNIAARLQGMAKPGDVVIAESTRQLVGSLFAYESLGPVELKGVPRPVTAWKVISASEIDDRFKALRSAATPFIGREEELDLLSRRWRQVSEEGGKVVLISGEPGVGKSRLTAAARDALCISEDRIVTYFCSQSFTSTALFPVVRYITRTCGMRVEDTGESRRKKLQAFLGPLETPGALALLIELLSAEASDEFDAIAHLSPAERRKATFDLLIQYSASLAQKGPVAIVFEDIHWADPSTLELLDLLIGRIEPHRILVIATFRPEFQPSWVGLANVTLLSLSRLPRMQQHRLIEAVAGSLNILTPELVDEIAERTDGVPLFVEELTKSAIEAGGTSHAVSRAATEPSSIPATLHASLMARLDRLGTTARQVAQAAAVIGREFALPLLKAGWAGFPDELDSGLEQLRSAGLIFSRGTGEDASYIFKHALVQDAAYSTLLRGQRQSLHRAVAERLSSRTDAHKISELIARHYRHARDSLRAAEWRLKAGEANNQRYAYREAIENLREGLVDAALLADTIERKELELRLNIALAVPLISQFSLTSGPAAEVIERAEALSAELGRPRPSRLLYHRSLVHHIRADYRLVIPVARELEESMKGHPIGLRGSFQRIFAEIMSGEDVLAAKRSLEELFERVVALGPEVDQLRHEYSYDFKAGSVPPFAMALWHAGYPDEAVRVCDYGRRRAAEISHLMTLLNVLSWEVPLHYLRGDLVKMEERHEEMRQLSQQENLAVWFPFVLRWQAFPTAAKGDVEAALAMLDEAQGLIERANMRLVATFFSGMRARILDIAHRGEEAISAVEKGVEEASTSDEKIFLSDLRRLRGEFLIRYRGRQAEPEAEKEFKDALAFARKQKALSYELRAAHSMANLMRSRGDESGGLAMLEPVYNRFTEGFDTVDLTAAKRTIEELLLATKAERR